MKNLFIVFIFLNNFIFSQTKNTIMIEYDYQGNNFSNKETLYANQNSALYIINHLNSDNKNGNKIKENQETSTYTLNQKTIIIDEKLIYLNSKSSLIYFTNKNYIVKDSLPQITWKLDYSETKIIGGFNCKKATTKFRGSDLVAWYSLQLPYPFGPFKLKGLPGVILELIYEESNFLERWVASKIVIPYKDNVKYEYNSSLPLKSYKSIIKDQEMEINSQMNAMKARLPEGVMITNTKVKRAGIEKIYEWEK